MKKKRDTFSSCSSCFQIQKINTTGLLSHMSISSKRRARLKEVDREFPGGDVNLPFRSKSAQFYNQARKISTTSFQRICCGDTNYHSSSHPDWKLQLHQQHTAYHWPYAVGVSSFAPRDTGVGYHLGLGSFLSTAGDPQRRQLRGGRCSRQCLILTQ